MSVKRSTETKMERLSIFEKIYLIVYAGVFQRLENSCMNIDCLRASYSCRAYACRVLS